MLRGEEHLDPRQHQEGGEDIEDPGILLHQRGAHADHDAAQHDNAEDAPEEHPVLVLPRDRQRGEDQRDDEDVVHGQRLFHHEGGHVFGRRRGAELPPDEAAEGDAQRDVEGRELQALRDADLLVAAVQHPEVERQQHEDRAEECQPQPDRCAEEGREKQFHHGSCAGTAPGAGWKGRGPGTICAADITTGYRQRGPVRRPKMERHPALTRGEAAVFCCGRATHGPRLPQDRPVRPGACPSGGGRPCPGIKAAVGPARPCGRSGSPLDCSRPGDPCPAFAQFDPVSVRPSFLSANPSLILSAFSHQGSCPQAGS